MLATKISSLDFSENFWFPNYLFYGLPVLMMPVNPNCAFNLAVATHKISQFA